MRQAGRARRLHLAARHGEDTRAEHLAVIARIVQHETERHGEQLGQVDAEKRHAEIDEDQQHQRWKGTEANDLGERTSSGKAKGVSGRVKLVGGVIIKKKKYHKRKYE